MAPVVQAIGYESAIALASRFGGMNVYLRESAGEEDMVALVIGHEARRALLQALGPGTWAVPSCRAWLIARRDEEIALRYGAGEPLNDLVWRFKLSRRHILRVLADTRCITAAVQPASQNPALRGQPDLFNTAAEQPAQET